MGGAQPHGVTNEKFSIQHSAFTIQHSHAIILYAMSYLPNFRLLFASILTTLFVLVGLLACSQSNLPVSSTPLPTALPPTPTSLPRGGNLTIRSDADVPNLRPWQPRSRSEEQLIEMLYSGLTRLDAQLRPQPDLATAWEAAPDGRVITFTLRSDVTWHDGQPLSAADVAYTLSALREISPTTALLSDMRRITNVSTPTSTTLVVQLTERYAPLLSMLTLPILPKHLLIDKDIASVDFWNVPVGSGPFQFEERKPGQSIALKANPRFYQGQPLLDRVAFIVAPNPKVAVDALAGGQLLLAELPWSQQAAISTTLSTFQYGSYPENGYYFLAMNMRPERPLNNLRVRQALAAALDVPRIVEQVTKGQGIPITNSAAPGSWADSSGPVTTTGDLQAARLFLDEAGWKLPEGATFRQQKGITLTLQLFVRGDDARRVQAAELIAQVAKQVGVLIEVEQADFETVIRSKYAPPYDFDLLLGSWSNGVGDASFADYAFYDPDDFGLFHSSQINQGVADTRAVLNITGFSDSAYDNQAAAARQLYNLTERSKALKLAQQRVATLKPYIFLWTDRIPVLLSERLTTLDGPPDLQTPFYLWNIERWHLKP